MGATVLKFTPRESLNDFVKEKTKVSLIRRTGGRKSSSNMAIHGENLAALAALKAGFGTAKENFKVDLIVIDPPYNVGGNQGYKNIWKGHSEKERDWAGDHGSFLDFMEPRIKIGRQLLTEDGVMMVNICDGEYCRLKILMDQVFGEQNCIGTIIWNKNQGANGSKLSITHEYILIYAKDATKVPGLKKEKAGASIILEKAKELKEKKVPYEQAQKEFRKWMNEKFKKGEISSGEKNYSFLNPDTYEVFRPVSLRAQDKPETRYQVPLKHPLTKKACTMPKNGWSLSEKTLKERSQYSKVIHGSSFIIAGKIVYGLNHSNVPQLYRALETSTEQSLSSVLNITYGGDKDLPDGIKFSTPKPVALIKELIKSYPKKDCRVLDYFGGSGTTAHAVVELNKEDGGNRSWILIEEMGSTYNKVLVPRMEKVDSSKDFATYELETVPVGGKELLKKFNDYSFDFLTSYHVLDEKDSIHAEGLNIVGYDKSKNQLVAIAIPSERKAKNFFVEELAAIKQTIKKVNAKSVIIYTLHGDSEEPWKGVDKSVLSGTQCKSLATIGVPDELVKEWNEVLEAMAA
ncbi:hypothetical protein DOM21_15000 [Bacteriovorax stolpii]|uniref:site-specific DNA-methyltransferase n=1 Tax=Bacteriovorax stolpii TaxID=960 RepID=UPI001157A8DB|nr:site-specific DNA-methyltransferase [Bacteriovorax stolpii]QDK42734.1 hypothetical protein DOM21_15000 [Bacteriovorax stolpii]